MGLIIRSSAIHAAGCHTTSFIATGQRILEYDGPRLSKDEADSRYEGRSLTYLFGVGDGSRVIDGHSMAMFLNHSCDPNCETSESRGRIWISSIRDIEPGEELTYDYNLYDGDEDEAVCNCGAALCRGSMFSPVEIAQREAARKAAAAEMKKQVEAEPALDLDPEREAASSY
jgi:SET domain-containing protein